MTRIYFKNKVISLICKKSITPAIIFIALYLFVISFDVSLQISLVIYFILILLALNLSTTCLEIVLLDTNINKFKIVKLNKVVRESYYFIVDNKIKVREDLAIIIDSDTLMYAELLIKKIK